MIRAMQEVEASSSDGSGRWSLVASIGSVLSAFVASACCVGPLLFALLGIGGAGLIVQLEPYRPYLVVTTLAFLGTGFSFSYRRARVAASSGTTPGVTCACPSPRANRAGRTLLWTATVLVAILLASPYVASVIFG
jgi:mercuric ion transport protein